MPSFVTSIVDETGTQTTIRPNAIDEKRAGFRQLPVEQLVGITSVGGQIDVKRRALGDLGEESPGRAER